MGRTPSSETDYRSVSGWTQEGVYSLSIALLSKGKAGMDSMEAEGEETREHLEGDRKGEFYTVISEH